jgi:CheY-like chemotaxis protein
MGHGRTAAQERSPVRTGQWLLIVDDRPTVRHGLRTILERELWIGEITEARSVAECNKEATTERLHLVFMDVRLPDGDGVEATRRIMRALLQVTGLTTRRGGDLTMLAASRTTAEVGRRLGVSQRTVRNQLSGIFVKNPCPRRRAGGPCSHSGWASGVDGYPTCHGGRDIRPGRPGNSCRHDGQGPAEPPRSWE